MVSKVDWRCKFPIEWLLRAHRLEQQSIDTTKAHPSKRSNSPLKPTPGKSLYGVSLRDNGQQATLTRAAEEMVVAVSCPLTSDVNCAH